MLCFSRVKRYLCPPPFRRPRDCFPLIFLALDGTSQAEKKKHLTMAQEYQLRYSLRCIPRRSSTGSPSLSRQSHLVESPLPPSNGKLYFFKTLIFADYSPYQFLQPPEQPLHISRPLPGNVLSFCWVQLQVIESEADR